MLFAALNYWQVGRSEELASQPSNTRALIRAVRLAARPDRHRRRRRSSPGPSRCPAPTDVKYRRLYPTGDLFADITGYYTFGLGSTQLEKTEADVLSGDTFDAAGARPRRDLQRRQRPVGRGAA